MTDYKGAVVEAKKWTGLAVFAASIAILLMFPVIVAYTEKDAYSDLSPYFYFILIGSAVNVLSTVSHLELYARSADKEILTANWIGVGVFFGALITAVVVASPEVVVVGYMLSQIGLACSKRWYASRLAGL